MFLGQELPTPKRAVQLAGPQLPLGVALGSGQYVVGLLLAALVLVPVFTASPMTGALIEIAFEGGHGTAAGMRCVMEDLGFGEGALRHSGGSRYRLQRGYLPLAGPAPDWPLLVRTRHRRLRPVYGCHRHRPDSDARC